MAISAERFTVSTAVVALNPPDVGPVSGGRIRIKNTNAAAADTLILGDAGVTASTGFALAGGESVEIVLGSSDQVYGVRGTAADVSVHVLRVG